MKNSELDLRSMVAIMTNSVNKMCNSKTVEEVNEEFVKVKDVLIEIYKHNVERVK